MPVILPALWKPDKRLVVADFDYSPRCRELFAPSGRPSSS